jgi:hypothetical protein
MAPGGRMFRLTLAQTMNTSAIGELVIQFLEPEITKLPSLCLLARVLHAVDVGRLC